MPSSMTPEEYVSALYEVCLGRPADAEGLAGWTQHLRDTADPTSVLAGLLSSDEARGRRAAVDDGARELLLQVALGHLGRAPRIVDVGAQALSQEQHIYAPLARSTRVSVVGFDPLADRLAERAAAEGGVYDAAFLPYALGDGAEHTLYVNNDDATSSLFPLDDLHNADFNHLSTLRTTRKLPVVTHRLDDVLPPGPVDLLKLDVQGAELMVLGGARKTLAFTGAVHCEVEFSAIYAGQPLFAEVEADLVSQGFYLVDLLTPVRYSYIGSWPDSAPGDRLLWGEAVFFRNACNRADLVAQAVVAAGVYGKVSLARHFLARASR